MAVKSNSRSPAPEEKDRKLCRYYMNGVCREGENCHFSHDRSDKPSMICKYYLLGSCSYGSSCRYDHVKPSSTRMKVSSAPRPVVLSGESRMDPERQENKMVTLRKLKSKESTSHPQNWADAPVFIPGQAYQGSSGSHNDCEESVSPSQLLSYSEAAGTGIEVIDDLDDESASQMLCPFAEALGSCPNINSCLYLHGLECEICRKQCLHPQNVTQQQEHRAECLVKFERDMEYSFAVQRSKGVTCCICMETVKDKPNPSERKFGILSDCAHPFCLQCIRIWRTSSHAPNKIVRACPICRAPSGFVTPSDVWVMDPMEKMQLIEGYKAVLRSKPCKYFADGKGTCPFSSSCFYRHANPDGSEAAVKVRHCDTSEGDSKVIVNYSLWNYVEAQENQRTTGYEEIPENTQ